MTPIYLNEDSVNICSVLEFEVGQVKLKSALHVCNLDPDANKAFREVFQMA
jgi:hypothetical protein